ncbi:hypothetical protein [Chondromyces apiculatus]|uniref:Uncharacterized protein n=1 Tax=Chondromyces apiculatus DSM 436 TaxID=1192034 RepID=A0A017T4U9_9BACT|nr:hypothetical protein [Chondromyces apiculatus]EYF04259.1 Hypothetical protein CAP_4736 [Chondromyces apiculatus DSM 436]
MSGLQDILGKAQAADYAFLIEAMGSPVNFSDDARLRALHDAFCADPSDANRAALIALMEREIAYLGSSDLAYFGRWLARRASPGAPIDAIVEDVARSLKVTLKPISTLEARLTFLVRAVVERDILALPEDQQREIFRRHEIGPTLQDELLRKLKARTKISVFPLLFSVLGAEVVEKLLPDLVVLALSRILGRAAARRLFTQLLTRFPAWAEWIGPVAWGASAAWLALDLQAPAARKTVPVLVYCGLLALRDSPAGSPTFWEDAADGGDEDVAAA